MKKMLVFWGIVLAVSLFCFESVAANAINLVVNGNKIDSDTPPVVINDRVLVPIRAVSEALNAKVQWIPETNTVNVTTEPSDNLSLLKVNGEPTTWPYWYEDGTLYMEYKNLIELLRIKYPPTWSNISYLSVSKQIVIKNKYYDVITAQKGDFTVISLNSLQNRAVINFEWNPDNENLVLK